MNRPYNPRHFFLCWATFTNTIYQETPYWPGRRLTQPHSPTSTCPYPFFLAVILSASEGSALLQDTNPAIEIRLILCILSNEVPLCLPVPVYRLPSTVYRLPYAVYRLPLRSWTISRNPHSISITLSGCFVMSCRSCSNFPTSSAE